MEKKGSDHKKAFGQFSSNKTQRPNTLKAAKLELNWLTLVNMMDFNKGDIVIKQSGIYLLIAGPQIGKVKGTTPRWLDFWVRVNNADIPNSNIRAVLMDPQEKTVVPLNVVLPLKSGDIPMNKNNVDNNFVFGLLTAYCMFYISILDFGLLA